MNNLLKFLRTLVRFSDETWKLLQPVLTEQEFNKNEFLLKKGQICNSLFYIDKGYCKSYYEIDGVVKNTGFYFENEIITNVNSFANGIVSEYNIVACEPLKTIVFDKIRLFQIADHSSEIQTLGRNCIRQYTIRQEEFSKIHKLYSSLERYEYIEKHHTELLRRVSLSQLASFLGVTRETLSRIRKRRLLF